MTNYSQQVQKLLAGMENQDSTERPQQDIQDIYVLIVREHEEAEDQTHVVDSIATVPTRPTVTTIQQDSFLSAYVFVCFSFLLIFAMLSFQLYCMTNPLTATVTIIPQAKQITLSGTMQLGRVLPPLTISQSQTTKATGHGHQMATAATGYLTFYNGQFQTVTIAAGTMLTGAGGISIITDQDAMIPAGNPAAGYGHTTIPTHAVSVGVQGNIPANDINQACCATSVLAANLTAFSGGQDERTYNTVTQHDIHSISTMLKTTLASSITGALAGQLIPQEHMQLLPCIPTVTSDHQPGDEATQVNVTVSATCSAIAFNSQELETKATTFLATQAQQKAGTGYSLFGTVNVSVKQASITNTTPHLVFLSFQATGRWIYGISQQSRDTIKHLLAGKTTQEAAHLLSHLPGVESATIRFSGFGDETSIPKTTGYIHLSLIVV